MTINQAITKARLLKPNTCADEEMVEWLSRCDRMVAGNIIKTHGVGENHPLLASGGYAPEDMERELLAPAPYDAMYPYWIMAQIDLANAEYHQYNASITLFNTEYQAFETWYHRNNIPVSAGTRFLF